MSSHTVDRPLLSLVYPSDRVRVEFSDNDLLAAVAAGDGQAFTLLMRRHMSKMVMLAQRVVFDHEQAREIVQEAFLRAWQNASKWDPSGTATFSTWLRRVVINLSISQWRKKRPQVDVSTLLDLPDPEPNGFDHMALSHEKRSVQEAMLQLPKRQRAAIALFYFENYSQVEAATSMAMTPKAFDSLLVRARRNLKKYLGDSGYLANGEGS